MFVAQAHSFTQQARLAITLAWIAGYTNLLTILTCGTVTSHVSGTTSNLGRDMAEGTWNLAVFALFLLVTFLCGAVISGFATELGRRLGWESIYVLPIVIETVLLGVFAVGVAMYDHHELQRGWTLFWMTGVASSAMGLQNATITRISSGVVRTTHVTGVLTDLGLETVRLLWWVVDQHRNIPPGSLRAMFHSARAHPTLRRLVMLLSIIGSFAIGACLGTFAFDHMPQGSMFPPVGFLMWLVYQDISRPIAEIEPSDLIDQETAEGIAVFHLRKDRSRRGKIHRMPDLQAWADRLPDSTRVVILDLGEAAKLNTNAALELRATLTHFARQKRQLIIAGLNGEQFTHLRSRGMRDLLHPENVCPDLELAIARGLILLEGLPVGLQSR